MGQLSNLSTVRLYSNDFTGCVPTQWKSFYFELSNNRTGLSHCDGTSVSVRSGTIIFPVLPEVTFTPTVTPTPTQTPPPSDADRSALTALYNATGGANWTNKTNWLSTGPISTWYGVTTNSDGRVTKLKLPTNTLRYALPSALGNLSKLEELDLSGNRMKGSIPAALANLSSLKVLNLSNNDRFWFNNEGFSGSIPVRVGQPLQLADAESRRQPAERVNSDQVGQPLLIEEI